MSELKYKVGDRVRIKSLDWYNENKGKRGFICFDYTNFIPEMSRYCGEILTINRVVEEFEHYIVSECAFSWTDEMIEGLVEEPVLSAPNITEGVFIHEKDMKCTTEYILPEGYIFKDEHGNVINATKIVLEKKKKEYPKTYKECCGIIGFCFDTLKWDNPFRINRDTLSYIKHLDNLMESFCKLLVCRDAYWKIAGEEMGLGKPWEPDWKKQDKKYIISVFNDTVIYFENETYDSNTLLAFPTAEMRDAFYENFKKEIEICKELL